MIKKINEFKNKDTNNYNKIISKLNQANTNTIQALENINNSKKNNDNLLLEFKKYFEESRLLTKQLGKMANTEIETDQASNLIKQTLENGAFVAKFPGAGGSDAIVALCLTQQHQLQLQSFWQKQNITLSPIVFSNQGLLEG